MNKVRHCTALPCMRTLWTVRAIAWYDIHICFVDVNVYFSHKFQVLTPLPPVPMDASAWPGSPTPATPASPPGGWTTRQKVDFESWVAAGSRKTWKLQVFNERQDFFWTHVKKPCMITVRFFLREGGFTSMCSKMTIYIVCCNVLFSTPGPSLRFWVFRYGENGT